MLKLTEKCKLLYDLIMKIPADLDEIRTELENGGYSLDELAAVSYELLASGRNDQFGLS